MVPPPSMQALVLAALFSGAVSMPEDVFREIGREERDSKKFWIETLEKLTAYSLGRANVVRTTNLETIQAFVMYLVSTSFPCGRI